MGYRTSLLVMTALLIAASPAVGKTELNVDFSIGWGGCYRPMEWTPIEIGITAARLAKPLQGTLSLSADADELTVMQVTDTFVLLPERRTYRPMVTKFAMGADHCSLKISDRTGRTVYSRRRDLWGGTGITVLETKDVLVGYSGRSGFGLARLGQNSQGLLARQDGNVYVKGKLTRLLPWDWTGYAPLDLLVLYDPDWLAMNEAQSKAICQWVSNGGRLLIVLGSRPLPASNPIAGMLPLKLGKPGELTVSLQKLDLHQTGHRDPHPKFKATRDKTGTGHGDGSDWIVNVAEAQAVICRTLTATDQRKTRLFESYGSGHNLLAIAAVGFGRVAVLGFDPAQFEATPSTQASAFWVHVMQKLLPGNNDDQNCRQILLRTGYDRDNTEYQGTAGYYYYEGSRAVQAADIVMGHLLSIPEMRPISIWWVVGLLGTLAVLLGPVDYLVLKRLDRLPWTWVTSACYIAAFTVAAYYVVDNLRAGEMQVRAVSLIDAVQGSDGAWSTTYAGVFAPRSKSYHLDGLGDSQWWSTISPTGQHSWRRGGGMATRQIYCRQRDGYNHPVIVPINIWSMQCLLGESYIAHSDVSATLQLPPGCSSKSLQPGDRVVLSITNHGKTAIDQGTVALARGLQAGFSRVPPGETKRFTITLTSTQNGQPRGMRTNAIESIQDIPNYGPGLGYQAYLRAACLALGADRRTPGIQDYVDNGAAVVYACYRDAPRCFSVTGENCRFNHIRMVRLVVFPQPAKPADADIGPVSAQDDKRRTEQ